MYDGRDASQPGAGSVIWGWLAAHTAPAGRLPRPAPCSCLALTYRVRVKLGEEADVTPGIDLPDLAIAVEPSPDDGLVFIQVQYLIDPATREAFLRAIYLVEPTRRRNGASDWRVFRDLGEDGRFVERFIVESWAEYVRLRARRTMADRQLRDAVEQFQQPGVPILVTRLISVSEPAETVDED